MNEYRQEHLRRKQADAERRKEEATVAARRADRQRNAGLLAAIGVALLALLILAPMRFSAIAGEEVDPIKQYLTTHATDEKVATADVKARALTSVDQIAEVVSPEQAAEIIQEKAIRETSELNQETDQVQQDAEGENFETTAAEIQSATEPARTTQDAQTAQTANVVSQGTNSPSVAIDFTNGMFEWDADGDGQVETYSVTADAQGGYVLVRTSQGIATEAASAEQSNQRIAIADATKVESIDASSDVDGPYLTVRYLGGADGQQNLQCVVRRVNDALVMTPVVEENASVSSQAPAPQVQENQAGQPVQEVADPQVQQPGVTETAPAAQPQTTPEEAAVQQNITEAPATAPQAEPTATVSAEDLFAKALVEEESNGGIIGFAESVSAVGQEQTVADTGYQVLVKYLVADSTFVGPETTLDSLFNSEDLDLAVIAQFSNYLPLLDPGADSASYIAMVDSSKFTGYGTVTHADFAMTNNNAEVLNDYASYDKNAGIAYIPKKLFDGDTLVAADNIAPVQVQLLVSYDFAAKGTDNASVEVPLSITSEIPGVIASDATSFTASNFDTNVTIPIVDPSSNAPIGLQNILVYEGGSETPMDLLQGNFASYDAETGSLTLQLNAIGIPMLKVRLVGADIATSIVDTIAQPTEAQAVAGNAFSKMDKAWQNGKLTNIDANQVAQAISKGSVYRYDGPVLKFTKGYLEQINKAVKGQANTLVNAPLEVAFVDAAKKASGYAYAPSVANETHSTATEWKLDKFAQAIYANDTAALGTYDVTPRSNREMYHVNVDLSDGENGGLESGFALPGYKDPYSTVPTVLNKGRSTKEKNLTGGTLTTQPTLDMSGLAPLDGVATTPKGQKTWNLLVGTGVCCHVTRKSEGAGVDANNLNDYAGAFEDNNPIKDGVAQGSGTTHPNNIKNDGTNSVGVKNYKDYVYMRPLYLHKVNNVPQYLVCGFVDASKEAQEATGIFTFKIQQNGSANVKKTSSKPNVTNNNANYAAKMEPCVYGIYDSYEKAAAAGPGKYGEGANAPKGWVKFEGTVSNGVPTSRTVSLKPGKYWAKELLAPKGYAISNAVLPNKDGLVVSEGKTASFEAKEDPILGTVTAVKKDDETNKDVTQGEYEFTLYGSDKKPYGSYPVKTAKGTNTVKWDNLPLGTYYVRETKATYPYMTDIMNVGDNDNSWHKVEVKEGATNASVTIKDKQRRGTVILNKIDEETKQGLGGAKFELYSAQDVTSLDGTKRHYKDQKVKVKKTGDGTYVFDANGSTELVSNNNGLIKVEGLYLNNGDTSFYMVETAPPSGHIADTNRVTFNFKKDENKKVLEVTQQKPNKPNGINIYTKDKRDDSNIANKVMGVWKKEDAVSITTSAATDAMAIRTPDNSAAYQPTLVPNGAAEYDDGTAGTTSASGTTLVVNSWFEGGNKLVLTARGSKDTVTIDGVKSYPVAKTGVTYDIKLVDGQNKEVAKDSYSGPTSLAIKANTAYAVNATASGSVYKVEIKESGTTNSGASVMTLAASAAASGIATEATTSKAASTVTATWDANQKVWIAKDLVPGTKYKVVIGNATVKVVSMSKEGGAVHFGRYATTATDMFAKGWLDQSGLAKDDAKIAYKGKTDANGYVGFRRIPVGEYVIGEIKPPVDESGHYTYLVDTNAHNFKVNAQNNLIADTDDASKGYHDADAAKEVQYKSFLFKEDVTRLRLSKRSTTGGEEEVVGAKLVLTDAEHVVVDEWTSTEEPHYIEGLAPGLYWLSEKETPQAYEWAEAVQIRLLPTGKVCHAVIYDTPLSVGVDVDKRQEIADPLDERVMENGDGKNEAALSVSPEGYYDYSLDVRSMSNSWLDELTMTDELTPATDGMARLVSIETPQAWQDYDGKMNVWYKTNKSSDRKSSRTTKSGYQIDNGNTVMPEGNVGTESSISIEGSTTNDNHSRPAAPTHQTAVEPINQEAVVPGIGNGSSSSPSRTPKSNGVSESSSSSQKTIDIVEMNTYAQKNIDIVETNTYAQKIIDTPEKSDSSTAKVIYDSPVSIARNANENQQKVFATVSELRKVPATTQNKTPNGGAIATGTSSEDENSATTVHANATLSDGHVNSWLTNGTFALDPDGDKRLEDYEGWELWEEDLSTMSSSTLNVESLDLADDEYVTAVRFEYGRVEAGFTTRPDGWDENIHRLHDDHDDILNASRMTFDAADASADAAASQLRALVNDLATKASRTAEKDLASRAASEKTKYEELVKSIAAYNAGLTEDSELPKKFIDAIQVPAYVGDDEPGQKIAAAADSAKLSIQAVIDTAQTAEGKVALSKSLPAMANKFKSLVSDETVAALTQQVADFVKAVDLADPDGIASATEGIKASTVKAIDEVAATAMAGRVHYAPAIVHMQVTDKYVADCKLSNSASAIAARNGGGVSASDNTGESTSGKSTPEDPNDPNDPNDPKDPKDPKTPLLDRITDTVEQSAKVRVMSVDTHFATQDGSNVITVENGKIPTADKVHYTGLTIGKEYVIKGEVHVRNGSDGDGIDGGIATNGGQPVTNSVSFVPTSEEGDVLVPFTLDVAELQARPAVAFETLYEGFSGKAGDVVLAEHRDINDPDQTLPVNPAESDFLGFGSDKANPSIRPSTPLAQTGDPVVIATIAVLAGGLVIGFIIWRRRRSA